MRKRYFMFLGLVVILASMGLFFAKVMMDSLYVYQTPLPLIVNQADSLDFKPMTRRVVMVLVDGLRVDQAEDAGMMPFLSELRSGGAWGRMHSMPPSFSQPGYSMIFTGAWPEWNGGPVMNVDYDQIPAWKQETIFSQINANQQKSAVSGYYWFEKLIPAGQVERSYYTPGEDALADKNVMEATLPWLIANEEQFVLIHFDQVDYGGHHLNGPLSVETKVAARQVDLYVEQIAKVLDFNRDTLVVLSDHGHVLKGGHGGIDEDTLTEPFIFTGAGVKPGKYSDIEMVDIAPTITTLLGVDIPGSSMGRVLTEMLAWDQSNIPAIIKAWNQQQTQLLQTYAVYLGEPVTINPLKQGDPALPQMLEMRNRHVIPERIFRSVLIGILLALLIIGLKPVFNRNFAWILLCSLGMIMLFHFRYGFLDLRGYTLSTWKGADEFIIYCSTTYAIALLIMLIPLGWKLGWAKKSPYENAMDVLRLVILSIIINLVPALLYYVLYGIVSTWYLPDFGWNYMALFFSLQAPILGGLGILFSAGGLVTDWFWKRRLEQRP